MVAIKRAPKKESAAPIITVPLAKVKLNEPEFRPEPVEVETKDGSRTFTVDPGLNALVEITDDHGDGTYDGVKFFQNFKMKWNEDGEHWEVRDGTGLGTLMTARYPGFEFDSDEDFDIDAADFDDFEFMCKIVPKKNPNTGQYIGSMCHYETIMAVPDPKRKKKLKKVAQEATDKELDELPYDDLSSKEEAEMNAALGDG